MICSIFIVIEEDEDCIEQIQEQDKNSTKCGLEKTILDLYEECVKKEPEDSKKSAAERLFAICHGQEGPVLFCNAYPKR